MKRVILRVMMLVAMASAAVTMSVHTSSKEVKASEKGDAVVEYAKNFVGNRYRYGGSSLTNGTDCSGFVMSVYAQILIYPATYNDYTENSPFPSVKENGTDYLLTAGKMQDYIDLYARNKEDKKKVFFRKRNTFFF